MERPYVFMQRALVTFKVAGLHSPLAGPAQEEFWSQLWVETLWSFRSEPVYRLRQKAGRRALFSAGRTIWTKLFRTLKKGLLLARRRTQEHRADCHEPDLFDLVNSKRRVRELIEHLEKKFTANCSIKKMQQPLHR